MAGAWQDLVLSHEYCDGDNGRGVGASHQTGRTPLALRCLEDIARRREQSATPSTSRKSPRLAVSRR